MARYATFSNGDPLFTSDINGIRQDAENAITQWRTVMTLSVNLVGLTLTDSLWLVGSSEPQSVPLGIRGVPEVEVRIATVRGNVNTPSASFAYTNERAHLRRKRWRIRASTVSNAVAVESPIRLGVYPVEPVGGPASTISFTNVGLSLMITLRPVGDVLLSVGSPPVHTIQNFTSPEFEAPATGWYLLAVTGDGTMASGARLALYMELQERNENA